MNSLKEKKHYFFGLLAFLGMIAFYFAILIIANSFEHALSEFQRIWYFILFISVGFGVQTALYFYIKNFLINSSAKASVAGSAGVSGVSMAACCAHHLTDFLAVLGLSVFAVLLSQYQVSLMLVAVFSNLLGAIYMLSVIKKHNLIRQETVLLKKIISVDLDKSFNLFLVIGLALIVLSVIYSFNGVN
ncbi:MAG: hypothetical protein COT90_02725 [Candidatus Diapherotrites archaeon CG10_big_fil_rev_8_21_14_0_10_31_34]|nr:MAG: hypothetical protein COT90_02725 [Candidatus Diapherotrites archaeon CG10_big_fil_rev_8_21_14_0_10_31_34]